MKRMGLIGLVLLTTTGCGNGWLPFRPFRGALCRGGCVNAAPEYAGDNCQGCAGHTTAYEGEMAVGGYNEYGGVVMNESPYYGGSTSNLAPQGSVSPMAPLQPGR